MNNKERKIDNDKWSSLLHFHMGYMVTDGDEDKRALGNFMRKQIRKAKKEQDS